jgi:hypothetical protein
VLYGYDLLHFARWWLRTPPRSLSEISESTLLDYVRDQLDSEPQSTPQTINHRLTELRRPCQFHGVGEIPPAGPFRLGHFYRTHIPLGYGRSRRAVSRFRLKQPRRLVVPLAAEEIFRFWCSFRTLRDLSLGGAASPQQIGRCGDRLTNSQMAGKRAATRNPRNFHACKGHEDGILISSCEEHL